MDGFGTTFLDVPECASRLADPACGHILYIEDFDLDADVEHIPPERAKDIPPTPPLVTAADVETARNEGFAAGLKAALEDAQLVQSQIQTAALQSLADSIDAAQQTLARAARQAADDGVRIILAILQACVPAIMAQHAATEAEAACRALMPGLSFEPELRARAHPDIADTVRDLLAATLPSDGCVLAVAADPNLAPGDVQIAWRGGGAERDTGRSWDAIRCALAPLGLPSLQELCHANRC